LTFKTGSTAIMNPLNGQVGIGVMRSARTGGSEVYVQLAPGESVILRAWERAEIQGDRWFYWEPVGPSRDLKGEWQVEFIEGGPQLPRPLSTDQLASWTELGGKAAEVFAGTARYRITFNRPGGGYPVWRLDLGKVCQSARIRLNGQDLGTLLIPPFRVLLDTLKARDNVLDIEITNTSANRIRDLDRRQIKWQNFHDINFVNIDYKKFDASKWPIAKSGLLGPVKLTPVSSKSSVKSSQGEAMFRLKQNQAVRFLRTYPK